MHSEKGQTRTRRIGVKEAVRMKVGPLKEEVKVWELWK